ncbi:hypothetical protein [Phocaeicola coprocola]|uniref:hypothetical protein n=1 Tax=Phocaeicola coprocola TaxID=310298 RepID=UPI003AEFCD97
MSRTLHLFGTDWGAMMVPIQVIRWYRMQCYDGTDSCATVVPIRRYCQVIEYIASWFVHPDNKTGCRFIVVDAYNKENVLHFYEKNGFKFLYSTESLEKEANHIPEDEHLESRMMYLDLLGYIR